MMVLITDMIVLMAVVTNIDGRHIFSNDCFCKKWMSMITVVMGIAMKDDDGDAVDVCR